MIYIYICNKKTNEFGVNSGKITDTFIIRNTNGKDKEIIIKKRRYNKNGFEIEMKKRSFRIDNIEKTEELFKCLGYDRFLRMKDKNYKYENKEYIAFIQEVENLGIFLEIESKNKQDSETRIKKLIELIKSLKLKIESKFDIRKAELLYKKQNSKENA